MNEALERGHELTAIVREPSKLTVNNPKLHVVKGDIFNKDNIAASIALHDIAISAYGKLNGEGFVEVAKALVNGIESSGVCRLLVVGGAGSLEVAPGVQVVDTPNFPDAWKPNALAQREALVVYQNSNINWTYLSPAALIDAGTRTGKYRADTERLVVNEKGESHISYEDYAVAMLDEVENPKFVRQRFTVAY